MKRRAVCDSADQTSRLLCEAISDVHTEYGYLKINWDRR